MTQLTLPQSSRTFWRRIRSAAGGDCGCVVVVVAVCFAGSLAATNISGFEMELLLAKLDYLQHELHAIKHGLSRQGEAIAHGQSQLETLRADSQALHDWHTARSSTGPLGSCRDLPTNVSGVYRIQLGPYQKPFEVYCEQASFGCGWTVIQRRFNGKENFYRGWNEYRDGFGNIGGEFWLGLKHLHQMTAQWPLELLVEIKDFDGNYGYARYSKFRIDGEVEQYRLQPLGRYSGTAGDSMSICYNEMFTTHDRDNDQYEGLNCAVDRGGAWWYYKCSPSNLNGGYRAGGRRCTGWILKATGENWPTRE